jgi:hypothetical protein
MANLFFRALSQGLQAFLPVAAALIWCRAFAAPKVSAAVKAGLLASIPLSFAGAWLFRTTNHQALVEASLALAAIVITVAAVSIADPYLGPVFRPAEFSVPDLKIGPTYGSLIVAGAAALIVVRQTMEIVAVFEAAAFQVRSFDATLAVAAGSALAALVSWAAAVVGARLPPRLQIEAVRTFCLAFLAQTSLYAFHESAEAQLLPWSDVLHAATEPYGPDGLIGVHFSDLLIALPIAVVAYGWLKVRWIGRLGSRRLSPVQRGAALVTFSSFLVLGMQQGDARPPQSSPRARPADVAKMAASPHLLFRHTGSGPDFGALAMAALDAPEGPRQMLGLTCQRVSFASGHGLCLHVERGVFNVYTAVVLDDTLKAGTSIKIEGLPSRTRTSPDGRIGAVTVFVIGDDYAADFSTRTTLTDLASGDQIGELEQFSTWRDGARIRAVDFNFWGVTFARDGNTFYAALRTAGKTYLVRGELALRRLTVLRENAECPSLSPDNRLLAYKKRVGPSPDSWRIHVLDLQTNTERIVEGEKRYIDDQVEWLDDRHVLYGVPRRTTSVSDVWIAAIDNAEPARVFLSAAESPIVVR